MSSERRKEQFMHACLCLAHFLPFYIVQAPNPRNGAAHWTIPYQLIKTTSWRHNLRQTIAHGDFLPRKFLHYVKFTKWSFSSPHNMFSFIVFCGYSRLYTHSCRLGITDERKCDACLSWSGLFHSMWFFLIPCIYLKIQNRYFSKLRKFSEEKQPNHCATITY